MVLNDLDDGGGRTYLYSVMENDCSPGTEPFLSDMVDTLTDQGLLKLSELSGEFLAKIMRPQSAQFLNTLAEEGLAEYENFAEELNPGGYREGELADGGRVSEMALPELLEYAGQSDGATAESVFTQLHQMTVFFKSRSALPLLCHRIPLFGEKKKREP